MNMDIGPSFQGKKMIEVLEKRVLRRIFDLRDRSNKRLDKVA
jgi:hypothetical protein